MTKRNGLRLGWTQLQVLGLIAKHRAEDGWCYVGSEAIAKELETDKETVQLIIRQLVHDKVLEQKEADPRRKVIPVKQTKQGYEQRLFIFDRVFPDIKSVLLRKR